MPESVPLYRELTVYDYLEFVARLRGIPRDEHARKIKAAMEKANLGDVSERIIGKLSKGFRQRVGNTKGRIKRIMIVAMARTLAVALWRYLETGMIPQGAVLKG